MNIFYVYHHLGLGDHLVCNAIVRNICKKFTNKQIITFCKPQYKTTVEFMYRDIINLKIICLHDNEVHEMLNNVSEKNKILIGHHHLIKYISNTTAEKAFYKQIGLKHEKKWLDFYVERDLNREEDLYKKLNPYSKNIIFLQEDTSRNFIINRNLIKNKEIEIIEPRIDVTDNIFDYLTLIERSQEVHLFESCFMYMVDLMLTLPQSIYAHRYARPLHVHELPSTKLNWNVYT
jgi:hypothetical protein